MGLRLILVRHGESSWNEEGRVQGFYDAELSERGRQQAEHIAQALSPKKIAAVYSSPLKRALDTARAIAQAHLLEVHTDPDLKEIDLGELEGLTIDELRSQHSEFLREWREGRGSFRMPGGESLNELQERAWRAIRRIVPSHTQGAVVVVSHTFTNMSIICHALGLETSHFRRLKQDIAAISILDYDKKGFFLALLNCTCHLGDTKSAS